MVAVRKDRVSKKVLFRERIKDVEARLGRSRHRPRKLHPLQTKYPELPWGIE
jgi:hypothetical protein